MQKSRFSILRFAAFLLSIVLLGYLLVIAKSILIPLTFAAFLAFLLKPVSQRVENLVKNKMWGIIITLFSTLAIAIGFIMLLGMQLSNIIGDFDNIKQRMNIGLQQAFRMIGRQLGMTGNQVETWLSNNLSNWSDAPSQILTSGLGSSAFVVGSTLLCILFVFFLLLYRTSFFNFFIYQFNSGARNRGGLVLRKVVKITKEYLNGLLLVALILATLNSLGLWIIGIKLALFWGVLGACLAIIPYIGTVLGGLLPFVYAIAMYGFTWQPLAVIIFYVVVQFIEGNIITPKIVGKSVRLNPFIAIVSLLVGGALWGIAGMILALPLMAVLKIAMANVDLLIPVAELFRDDLYKRENIFAERYDHEKHRIMTYFTREKD